MAQPFKPHSKTAPMLALVRGERLGSVVATLWATRRRLYLVTVPVSVGLPRDIGDIVTVTWPVDNLAGSQLGIIVGETFSSLDATIAFIVLV